jgi:hypothetical protein
MLYWVHSSFRRGTVRLPELVFWVLVWGGFGLLALFPGSVAVVVQELHLSRPMDLVMVVAFMLISAVLFLNHLELRRLQKKLQELVREIALKDP